MPDYAGNADKHKKPPEARKTMPKVVTGEVVTKPPPLGSRFKNIFLGGDFNTAAQFVAVEVLVPALRNLVVDVVIKGVENVVFGEIGVRRPRPNQSYAPRIQYNNPTLRPPGYPQPQRAIERWSVPKKTQDDVLVGTKAEADMVVEHLLAAVEQYEVVSVADLNDLLGQPGSAHTDNKWGWTNLASISVNQTRNGWVISFPPVEELS